MLPNIRLPVSKLHPLRPGTIIDTTLVVSSLVGEGGMSVVYRASDLNLERDVAIKFLSLTSDNMENRDRFAREAKALSKLQHKNILKVYRFGIWQDQLYLVLELLEGEGLDTVLARENAIPLTTCLDLMIQAVDGLAAAHFAGVLHRDTKPGNRFVSRIGSRMEQKIVDFGLCKMSGLESAQEQALTFPGQLLGSVRYMSPEQCTGAPVGPQSDVYSLGVTLYELISGLPPFDYETAVGILYKHVNDPVPLFREKFPYHQFASQLDDVFSSLLAKKPEDRPQSMAEVRVLLRQLQTFVLESTVVTPAQIVTLQAQPATLQVRAYILATALLVTAALFTLSLPWTVEPLFNATVGLLGYSGSRKLIGSAVEAAGQFGDFNLTSRCYSAQAALSRRNGDHLVEAQANCELSKLYLKKGNESESRSYVLDALACLSRFCRARAPREASFGSLLLLTCQCAEDAQTKWSRELDDQVTVIATYCRDQRDYQSVISLYQWAIRLLESKKLRNYSTEGNFYYGIGMELYRLHKYDAAIGFFRKSMDRFALDATADVNMQFFASLFAGEAACLSGDTHSASKYLDKAEAIAHACQDNDLIARVLIQQAQLNAALGKLDRSRAALKQARELEQVLEGQAKVECQAGLKSAEYVLMRAARSRSSGKE